MKRAFFLASLVAFAVGCSQDVAAPTGLPVVAAQSDYTVVGTLDRPEASVIIKVMTLRGDQPTQMNSNSGASGSIADANGRFPYGISVRMPPEPGVYWVEVIDSLKKQQLSTTDVEIR